MTDMLSGSTRTSTTTTTPVPPTLAPFAPGVQRKRTTLIRNPATRAARVTCLAARRATRHLRLELCSTPLVYETHDLAFTYLATASSDSRLPIRFAYTSGITDRLSRSVTEIASCYFVCLLLQPVFTFFCTSSF
jgi:hypothetical protein